MILTGSKVNCKYGNGNEYKDRVNVRKLSQAILFNSEDKNEEKNAFFKACQPAYKGK